MIVHPWWPFLVVGQRATLVLENCQKSIRVSRWISMTPFLNLEWIPTCLQQKGIFCLHIILLLLTSWNRRNKKKFLFTKENSKCITFLANLEEQNIKAQTLFFSFFLTFSHTLLHFLMFSWAFSYFLDFKQLNTSLPTIMAVWNQIPLSWIGLNRSCFK